MLNKTCKKKTLTRKEIRFCKKFKTMFKCVNIGTEGKKARKKEKRNMYTIVEVKGKT